MQTGPLASKRRRERKTTQALTGDVQERVFDDCHLRSGSIGARALNPITAGPLPATLLGPLASHSINKHIVLVHVNRLHSGGELSLRGALLQLGIDSVPSTYISGLTPLARPEQKPPESTGARHDLEDAFHFATILVKIIRDCRGLMKKAPF